MIRTEDGLLGEPWVTNVNRAIMVTQYSSEHPYGLVPSAKTLMLNHYHNPNPQNTSEAGSHSHSFWFASVQ